MSKYLERIAEANERSREIEGQLADPDVASQPGRFKELAKDLASLRPVVGIGGRYEEVVRELDEARQMSDEDDPELAEMARGELESLIEELANLDRQLFEIFIPKDPRDEKNAIFEIRAGTGGDEAALFAGDLFRMYVRYAERLRWKVEMISSSETPGGGFKEVIAMINGTDVFSRFKYERGVHRVQRVPTTEAQGRIHTSTVTVAVMPEAEDVDVEIDPQDLRIDVMRAGGPGGQSVNTTDSAVRITHLPTGLVVQCQDEKSQHKNKAKAMKVLGSRLLDLETERVNAERASERKEQVGTGERSEKIRTYNFPQNRITDHRAGITLHKLDSVLEGDLKELLDGVRSVMLAKMED
ncbi:MAG TPA: peptide chain release factor 1 [Myxococcales bacterium]|jgi:peptide chain release factor 1|nr:peptide chain release factor 1 [Myxococcales bacterium]HIM01663.1 peptide chain release factor 1 [Myxococcales bacterium]